jgi:hypothetical protein
MNKLFLVLSLAVFFISCGEGGTQKEISSNADKAVSEQKEIKNPELALADFDQKAAKWVNKEVKVKGIVDHVCKHGGKKLLLVNDDGDVHVESDSRFDDALVGDEITLTGIVKEFVVDEAYCLQKEEDFIQDHKEGKDNDKVYENKMKQIKSYRDSMKTAGVDHLSFYSLQYVSHQVKE